MKKIRVLFIIIAIIIFAYGVYTAISFPFQSDYSEYPRHMGVFGRIGEISNSMPYLLYVTIIIPSVLLAISTVNMKLLDGNSVSR